MELQKTSYDLVVAGGGVFGLWVAKRGVEAGLHVLLVERERIGAGASGGLLGALMPHIPTGWNEKKQFQFDALSGLADEITTLEEETGIDTGYGRVGRVMPLRKAHFVELTKTREEAARSVWHQGDAAYSFTRLEENPYPIWIDPAATPFGLVRDTLAARVRPLDYLRALKHWLATRADIVEGVAFHRLENGVATIGNSTCSCDAVVLAQGYDTFSYLRKRLNLDLGIGIKGQAAFFESAAFERDDTLPIIYDDGVYIVPHRNGTIAVGSTSEKAWTHPSKPDRLNLGFLDKAKALSPLIRDLEPTRLWAGVRPKSHEREPIVGRIDERENLYVATGGFKISFGIAHLVAEHLIAMVMGNKKPGLPASFSVAHHLAAHDARAAASSAHASLA